ncbi:hypothetical protein FIBSPDRAFT_916440 [Athelia psychrophila]|uniref:Uncharacterized protein n=1 Tax=Athelia psychrophila TaxID=1759441 RepID=A0A166V032_9AGAM|nr:hypothetical protein FIBSPDRAFT_916440 [Fibularhizoctonia sp. CBS 109695]
MSNKSPYTNDPNYPSSGYPPPPHSQYPHSDEYKASYDDLVDQYAEPYSKTSQHQTFSPALSTAVHQPPYMSKQSYSSEMTGKDSEEHYMPSSTPRILPMKEEKVADTRTVWQKVLPESMACRLYVCTIVVQTIVDMTIEADLFIRFQEVSKDNPPASEGNPPASETQKMAVYVGIFALAHAFQFAMAVDAVYARNTLQFMALAIFNALFLLYAVIQITEIKAIGADLKTGISHIPVGTLTTIIPIVIAVAELIYIGLAWKIYHEFGWKVYKFLGADRRIKQMFGYYQVFQCLVKFDVFFWIGFSVQFIWIVLEPGDWEYYVTCAALPLSIVLLVEGHLAARHENKWMMITFMTGCTSGLVYFVYKLVKVWSGRTGKYQLVWKSLSTFSVISIMLLLTTFIFACIVMHNFGRGLKTTMAKKSEHTRWGSQHLHHRAMSANPNRMSIE